MPALLIIDKNSVVKPYNAKTFAEDELYKKAGFKNKEGFAKYTVWNVTVNDKPCTIELYGKTAGRAGQENKYEFPPPVDNTLFFGSCILVCKSQNTVVDILPKDWEKVYEQLYGGFEDINADDSEDEESDSDMEGVPTTKEGYVKDGFIVDDMDDSDYSETSSEEIPVASSKKKATKKVASEKPAKKNAKSSKKPEPEPVLINAQAVENIKFKLNLTERVLEDSPSEITSYLSCTDELEEEAYI
jgi:hypothetical protein